MSLIMNNKLRNLFIVFLLSILSIFIVAGCSLNGNNITSDNSQMEDTGDDDNENGNQGDDETPLVHTHIWGNWITTTPPSCMRAGEETRVCQMDSSHTETRELSATGHKLGEWVKDSLYHWKECFVCHEKISYEVHKGDICSECGYESLSLKYSLSLNRDSYSVIGFTGEYTDLVIPESYNGLPVVEISTKAFLNCSSLVSVTISDNIMLIADNAFSGCGRLSSVHVGNNVKSIGYGAFEGCNQLKAVYISDLAAWCNIYFSDASANPLKNASTLYLNRKLLTELVVPNNINSIKQFAFYGCSTLNNITISESVTAIGDWAFAYCSSLNNISICSDMVEIGYNVFTNSAYYKNTKNWENSVLYIGQYLIKVNEKISGECYIKQNTTSIAESAFQSCSSLSGISFPNGLLMIQSHAFYDCLGLTDITIPDSVITIGLGAFSGCDNVQRITIPFVGATLHGEKNRHFGYIFGAESYNIIPAKISKSLCEVTVLYGDTIADYAFYKYEGLKYVKLPNSIKSIGKFAFGECEDITQVILGGNLTSIGRGAFGNYAKISSIFYNGTSSEWKKISIETNNSALLSATRYYYSEVEPSIEQWEDSNHWWHYVNSTPTPWVKDDREENLRGYYGNRNP